MQKESVANEKVIKESYEVLRAMQLELADIKFLMRSICNEFASLNKSLKEEIGYAGECVNELCSRIDRDRIVIPTIDEQIEEHSATS